MVKALLARLPIKKWAYFSKARPSAGRTVYYKTLGCASKTQTKTARASILLEKHGADWSPFEIGFASPPVDMAVLQDGEDLAAGALP